MMQHSSAQPWIALLVLLGLSWCNPAMAEPRISDNTYTRVMAAIELADEGQIDLAIDQLQDLADGLGSRPFDQAIVLQQLSAFQIEQEDYATALNNLDTALSIEPEKLTPRLVTSLRYLRAQLLIVQEQFEPALAELERWRAIAEQPPRPHGIFLIAYAHFQLKQYGDTAANLELIIDLPDRNERWVDFLFYAYLLDEEIDQARRVLLEALNINPLKQSWWRYLANIYMQQDNYSAGLGGLSYARMIDSMPESQLTEMARLYAYLEIPEKASRLYEQDLEDGLIEDDLDAQMLLATFWALAREHDQAVRVLSNSIEQTADIQAMRMLGQMHLNRMEYQLALDVLQQALELSSDEQRSQIHYFVGVAAFNLDRYSVAEQAFRAAAGDETFEARANDWLERVRSMQVMITPDRASELIEATNQG